jgi:hypothetical protein
MSQILKLGMVDRGVALADQNSYFREQHDQAMLGRNEFREEKDDTWSSLLEIDGGEVRSLQSFLRSCGFYPAGEIDGIFGYRTLSAARLFQEYVRGVEGRQDMGTPDGVVGPKTQSHIQRWRAEGRRADWFSFSPQNPTPEYRYWMAALNLYQQINLRRPINRVVELVDAFTSPTDTLKVSNWRFDPNDIHLVGIRRQEWRQTAERKNDDIFVLLLKGLAFKFYGSTDPNPREADRQDEPYLVRGQHRYRFGWHKLSELKRVYRAFQPAGSGVLVCRDFTHDDALTDEDLAGGLSANSTINIHWSGIGTSNWSAGCQVISGGQYLNHSNVKIDCSAFAAARYADLPAKTRGAYNALLDLMTVFAPRISVRNSSVIYYTLLYERDFEIDASPGQMLSKAAFASLSTLAGADLAQLEQDVAVNNIVDKLVRNS